MPKLYTTAEVAKAAKITKMTLHHWVWKGNIPKPKQQMAGNVTVWLWTEHELKNVLDFRANHFKGKGRSKPKQKKTAKA